MSDETADRPTYKVVQVRACDLKVGDVVVRQRRTAAGPASKWVETHKQIEKLTPYLDAQPPKVALTMVGVGGALTLDAVELVDVQVESGRVSSC